MDSIYQFLYTFLELDNIVVLENMDVLILITIW